MDGGNTNLGKQTLDLVRETLTEYDIPFTTDPEGSSICVTNLPEQSFGLTLCDDGIEATIFAAEASWHCHFDDAEEARTVFINLIEGNFEIETTYRGDTFQSTILQEHDGDFKAYSTKALFNNPFKKVTAKVYRNQVKVERKDPSKMYEE